MDDDWPLTERKVRRARMKAWAGPIMVLTGLLLFIAALMLGMDVERITDALW